MQKKIHALLFSSLIFCSFTFAPSAFASLKPNAKISLHKPVFASPTTNASSLVDGALGYPNWTFSADSWAAIQVGQGPSKVLLLWSEAVGDWSDSIPANQHCTEDLSVPVGYEIFSSNNSTNGSDGTWTLQQSITHNTTSARAHLINFSGASWIKVHFTSGTGPIDELEVFDASNGIADSWFLLGTSITEISERNFTSDSSVQSLVHARDSNYTPAIVRGGVSCISSTDVASSITDYMESTLPLHFWAIEMGTNDAWGGGSYNVTTFTHNMTLIIDSARAHGIEPILARPMSTNPTLTQNNWQMDSGFVRAVDSLQRVYQLLQGPDFYSYFLAHPEGLGPDGVHPVEAGALAMRHMWAESMLAAETHTDTTIVAHVYRTPTQKKLHMSHDFRFDLLGRIQRRE